MGAVKDAKAEVKAEIARTDSKASLLLAFDGVALAGVWSVGAQPWVPVAARIVGAGALVLLLASVTLLLLVVRPRLSPTAARVGFPRWAELTAEGLTAELATDRTADHVVALSRIVVAKMRALQRAVTLTLATGGPLAVAGLLTVVMG
ncbi:integral membrane plasmid transfer protein [Streptomyces albus subsp. chlorinus]|uniref:Pycsar system effector family protein n=1 Tax=Streptomyces albus TaxID=1888 RepID=UPI00156F3F6E|nr:Pycsar system effector family protein [Streptomyces albus]NSC22602.1 integral membrane plasmid transfer protein [Streptomyces albus subsp. chlorinus]